MLRGWNIAIVARKAIAQIAGLVRKWRSNNKKNIDCKQLKQDLGVNQAILQYLTERHCSSQWRDVLSALAEELSETMDVAGLRAVMWRVGTRFAKRFDPGACTTLVELERAVAQIWLDVDWGWTSIEDVGGALVVRHFCAPLNAALGDGADTWSPAFLEGAYQHWFRMLGSSETLRVSQSTPIDATGCVEFRFGR
ncbi:cellulose biosynthesis protein BcsD [Cupriavidus basilensis]|uniref:cellulose biosynthesis protein BcsD n=1 Tax=Cupriavidus basilensis TaxID=68895 RepID=UPI0020C5D1B3|nr:cellulose biosynthesis protein BcsD [Cupriavidus basilensis]